MLKKSDIKKISEKFYWKTKEAELAYYNNLRYNKLKSMI